MHFGPPPSSTYPMVCCGFAIDFPRLGCESVGGRVLWTFCGTERCQQDPLVALGSFPQLVWDCGRLTGEIVCWPQVRAPQGSLSTASRGGY